MLSTFVQENEFYTAFHVACLRPRIELTTTELLYYCACIKSNRYRFSYGRQANRTLKELQVPSQNEIPAWVHHANPHQFDHAGASDIPISEIIHLKTDEWKNFRYDEIFDINKGYYNKKPPISLNSCDVPFISATEKRNGITSFVSNSDLKSYSRNGSIDPTEPINKKLFSAKCVTVTNNGSVGEAFYQPVQFSSSHDVNPLYLKDKSISLSPEIGLFLATLIRAEKYRWSYGRKWRPIRMPSSIIRLPTTESGEPDWDFMERYIKSLPFSSQLNGA